MICLSFAALVAACVFLALSKPEASQQTADVLGMMPVAQQDASAALPEAVARGECVRLSGQVYQCRRYDDQTVLWLKKIAVSGMEPETVLSGISRKDICICYCEKTTVPQIGSVVCVEGTLDAFSSARNPGEFDQARYYWMQGVAFRLKDARLLSASKSKTPFRAALMRLRRYAGALLFQYAGERDGGILSAMLLGDKTGVDDSVRTLYAQSGISHVLAISGLHISLLGALLYRLFRRMGIPLRISMAACCAFLISYSVMAGMSASTLRAVVMFVIGLNAERVRRTYDMKTALGVSMALQLFRNPRLIGTAAFQLSFGAVAGIAWLEPVLSKICVDCLPRKKSGMPKMLRAFLSCIAVSLTTLPILLVHQYEYAVYGMFFNLLVLPSVSALLPAGFLLLFFAGVSEGCAAGAQFLSAAGDSGIGVNGGLFFRVAAGTIEIVGNAAQAISHALAAFCRLFLAFYEHGSRFVGSLPGSLLRGRPHTVRVCVYAAMLVLLVVAAGRSKWRTKARKERRDGGLPVRLHRKDRSFKNRRRGHWRGFFGIGWLALALMILLMPVRQDLTITMLDVGQGDGICIEQTPGHAVLIDCGSSDQRKLFENRLAPFLKYRGVYEVDAIFLSHLDNDHVSAVYDLLKEMRAENMKVRQIVIGGEIPRDEAYERLLAAAEEARVPVHVMRTGEVYAVGTCRLTCLGPSAETGKTGERNACSLILRLDYGDFQALFTGDADARAELTALHFMEERMPQDPIELLKVAHHGSRNSASEEFLQSVSPRVAIISAGKDNSYGHPHEETLRRLMEQGCDIYQTPENGAITIRINEKGMRVETFLDGEDF